MSSPATLAALGAAVEFLDAVNLAGVAVDAYAETPSADAFVLALHSMAKAAEAAIIAAEHVDPEVDCKATDLYNQARVTWANVKTAWADLRRGRLEARKVA